MARHLAVFLQKVYLLADYAHDDDDLPRDDGDRLHAHAPGYEDGHLLADYAHVRDGRHELSHRHADAGDREAF